MKQGHAVDNYLRVDVIPGCAFNFHYPFEDIDPMQQQELNLEWKEVNSSNIGAVAYDKDHQTIYVKFMSGSVYSYSGADQIVYTGLLTADSMGQYLARKIKPYYQYELVSI